jgi:hypothetical protein
MQKRRVFLGFVALCLLAAIQNYLYFSLFYGYEAKVETKSEEPLKLAIKEEVFGTLLNGTNITGNICLVGLRGSLTDEWLDFIRQKNHSRSKIFIIGPIGQHSIASNEVNNILITKKIIDDPTFFIILR